MSKVVVIGGGISGLSSALCLLRLFRDAIEELTVVASEFPGDYHAHDYASPWAGANWESFAKENEIEQIQRDKLTYKKLMQLAEKEPSAGIQQYRLKQFVLKSCPVPWYIKQKFVQDIAMISDQELTDRNLNPREYMGFEFTTVTVTPLIYNSYLISQIKSLGGTCRKVPRLDVIEDIIDVVGCVPDLVINCTGVNAGKLLRQADPTELEKVHPIKGQILQVYEDLPFQMVIEQIPSEDNPLPNQFLNIFPRPGGGCIIGGIFNKDDWSRTIDDDLSTSILRVVKNHIPEMKSTTVYNTYIACRPGREGGVRIGLSEYTLQKHKGLLRVVHNYGIGGAGYQSSYGSAMEVCFYASQILGGSRSACPYKL